jgi:hypothetical protein
MLGAATVNGVGGRVELLAADAVIAFIRAPVQIAARRARTPLSFHRRSMTGFRARTDEVVERQPQRPGECLEA